MKRFPEGHMLRYLRQRFFPLLTSASRRLHLGCGSRRAEGWLNVDIRYTLATDLLDDARSLRRFPRNWADAIYACHVLENFDFYECSRALSRWRQVLRPGGELRISVPDLDRITAIYQQNLTHFHTPGNLPWTDLIYGKQLDPFDYHKNGFNLTSLRHLLEGLGFEGVEEYAHAPHFIPGMVDASLTKEPFGEYISLNVKAVKR